MSSTFERRISRLEQSAGGRDNDELVEHELSEKGKDLLRDVLTGLMPPEELEAMLNERRLVSRSSLPTLSPEGRAQLDETLRALGGDQDDRGRKHDWRMP